MKDVNNDNIELFERRLVREMIEKKRDLERRKRIRSNK